MIFKSLKPDVVKTHVCHLSIQNVEVLVQDRLPLRSDFQASLGYIVPVSKKKKNLTLGPGVISSTPPPHSGGWNWKLLCV